METLLVENLTHSAVAIAGKEQQLSLAGILLKLQYTILLGHRRSMWLG